MDYARRLANAVGEICIYIKNKQQGVRESRPEASTASRPPPPVASSQKPEAGNTMTAPATCGVIKDTSPTGHGPICNQPTRPIPVLGQDTPPLHHRKTIALNQN